MRGTKAGPEAGARNLYARLVRSVNEPFSVRDLMQRPSLDYFEQARRVFQPH